MPANWPARLAIPLSAQLAPNALPRAGNWLTRPRRAGPDEGGGGRRHHPFVVGFALVRATGSEVRHASAHVASSVSLWSGRPEARFVMRQRMLPVWPSE